MGNSEAASPSPELKVFETKNTRKDNKHKRTPSTVVTADCGARAKHDRPKAHGSAFNESSAKVPYDEVSHIF